MSLQNYIDNMKSTDRVREGQRKKSLSLLPCFSWRYLSSLGLLGVAEVGHVFDQYFLNPPVCPGVVSRYFYMTTVLVTTMIV